MIDTLNSFLQNAEKFIVSYRKIIGKLFLLLSLLALPLIFYYPSIKETGEQALNVLLFLLFLPIFSRVLGIKLAQAIMPLRKEIGIFMWALAFVHGAGYIFEYPTFIISQEFWWQEGMITYFAIGVISLSITLLLTLTSNIYSIQLLGKHWKTLHRGVYIIAVLTVLHVVLLEWTKEEIEIGKPILLCIYFIGKVLEWKWITLKQKIQYPKWQKWLCVPCGYIYNPLIWDVDSGIKPGTEFTDIPKSWKCPVCWVSKSDFVLYDESWEQTQSTGKIIEKTMLNTNTLELVIETQEIWKSKPWQFMTFYWVDALWSFTRTYSIAKQENQNYTFLIKLNEQWRWAKLLQSYKAWTEVSLWWVHGNFILKQNKQDKIFVASWTWLAPIYNMILHAPPETKISLYFSVSTLDELFYVKELQAIKWLNLHIHVTREVNEWFETGRIDVSTIPATSETEWYLCGNPRMIEESREKLLSRWFQNIYSEEFN